MRFFFGCLITPFLLPAIAYGKGGSEVSLSAPYTVTVVCDLSSAIKAGGYEEIRGEEVITVIGHLTEASCKAGEIEIILVSFAYGATPLEAVLELNRLGFRLASVLELLAIGAGKRNLQGKFTIVTFGSKGSRPLDGWVLVLDEEGGRRKLAELNLSFFLSMFPETYRFAAVRIESK